MVQWWFWMAFSIAISTQSFVKWRLPQGPLYQCQRGGPGCGKKSPNVAGDDRECWHQDRLQPCIWEHLLRGWEVTNCPKWSHTEKTRTMSCWELKWNQTCSLNMRSCAPFHFQWHCSNIMGSAKLSRPPGRCAEAWRLSHVWHTHRHFCHRRMGDPYPFVLPNITMMKCCHTVILLQVCFILFSGICHFVQGCAYKEGLDFCVWNTSKNYSLCAASWWEFINPVLYVSCKLM